MEVRDHLDETVKALQSQNVWEGIPWPSVSTPICIQRFLFTVTGTCANAPMALAASSSLCRLFTGLSWLLGTCLDTFSHSEHLSLGDKEETESESLGEGGKEGLDQTCEASRGKFSCQPTHMAFGQVRTCVKSIPALFGGFQPALSPTRLGFT